MIRILTIVIHIISIATVFFAGWACIGIYNNHGLFAAAAWVLFMVSSVIAIEIIVTQNRCRKRDV